MKKILAAMALITLCGCTDATGAKKALEGAGYSNIQMTGYSMFSCGQDDVYKTKFSATGPTGKQVTGAVCAGIFKGSTIRTD